MKAYIDITSKTLLNLNLGVRWRWVVENTSQPLYAPEWKVAPIE